MDEEAKKRVLGELLAILMPSTKLKMGKVYHGEEGYKKAETLEEVIFNHKINLKGKEFIVIGESIEDSDVTVTVVQMDKRGLRHIITKLIQAYDEIIASERS